MLRWISTHLGDMDTSNGPRGPFGPATRRVEKLSGKRMSLSPGLDGGEEAGGELPLETASKKCYGSFEATTRSSSGGDLGLVMMNESTAKPTPSDTRTAVYHLVAPDEPLASVCIRYGCEPEDIVRWNFEVLPATNSAALMLMPSPFSHIPYLLIRLRQDEAGRITKGRKLALGGGGPRTGQDTGGALQPVGVSFTTEWRLQVSVDPLDGRRLRFEGFTLPLGSVFSCAASRVSVVRPSAAESSPSLANFSSAVRSMFSVVPSRINCVLPATPAALIHKVVKKKSGGDFDALLTSVVVVHGSPPSYWRVSADVATAVEDLAARSTAIPSSSPSSSS